MFDQGVWNRCRGWILPALRPECASEGELIADLASGRAQLWPGERSAMVTQCVAEARGPCLHVWLAGGELKEILEMKPGVEAWGRAQGCTHVTIDGRPGWARVLRRHGYALRGAELERRL
jgi:hypothetical protein